MTEKEHKIRHLELHRSLDELAADVEDERACRRWVDAAVKRYKRADILVHNAALCPAVDTVSLTDADLEATLAAFSLTRVV